MRLRRTENATAQFTRFFESHYRDIAGYVSRRVPTADVDDVVAQVFTVAWRRFSSVPSPPEDRLYLFGVARRCVADARRSDHRQLRLHSQLVEASPRTLNSPVTDSRYDLVLEAMSRLPELDQEALHLILWDNLKHEEAAVVMECSVAAFESRYRRARNAVREAVATASTRPATITRTK
jgi:RNA polymerase sigma-70 factor (ECF subfamily)